MKIQRNDCEGCSFPAESGHHREPEDYGLGKRHRFKPHPFSPKRIGPKRMVKMLMDVPMERGSLAGACHRSDWLYEYRDTIVALLVEGAASPDEPAE